MEVQIPNVYWYGPTYAPSEQFLRGLDELDDYLMVRWREKIQIGVPKEQRTDGELQIWSCLPDKRPVMEHFFERNNHVRVKPLNNWDMEYIVLGQLRRGRRWQFTDPGVFQDEMIDKQRKMREAGQADADARLFDFMADDYWSAKRNAERMNNDLGRVQTKWGGTDITQEGQK